MTTRCIAGTGVVIANQSGRPIDLTHDAAVLTEDDDFAGLPGPAVIRV